VKLELLSGKFSASTNSGMWEHMKGELLFLAWYNFIAFVKKIFNCGKIQNTSLLTQC